MARHAEGLFAIHVGAPDPLLLAQEKDVFGDRLSISIERTLFSSKRTAWPLALISSRSSSPLVSVTPISSSSSLLRLRAMIPSARSLVL